MRTIAEIFRCVCRACTMNRAVLRAKVIAFATAALSLPPVYLTADDVPVSLTGPELPAAVGVDQPGLNLTESGCGGDGDQGTRTPVPDESETVENPDVALTPAPWDDEQPRQPELTSELIQLRGKVRSTLKMYQPRCLNTQEHNPWEVMHAVIGFGVDANLLRGGPRGEKVNAISWLCYNGACKGQQMLWVHNGQLVARKGVGLQGHYGQFLAILAQSHVPLDYPVVVSGKTFSLADLVEHERQDCQAGEELTFKLIALMHYTDDDETWKSRDGQTWSIERLVREELAQPIRGAACGGTHRLMGISYAVNKRAKRGKPIDGEFARGKKFIDDYHRYTFSLQNADGSFSTQWFNRREAKPDVDRRLKTTGHILEWLVFSLSDEELRQPRTVKAVNYLSGILLEGKRKTWEIGPLGHATHALLLYDQRVFQPHDKAQPEVATTAPAVPSRKHPKVK
jgi:hypothetical protein